MKEDDFLTQFREEPRPEFAEQLYRRINKPMNNPPLHRPHVRRLAFAGGLFALLLLVSLAVSPAARAFAGDLVRQIGAFTVAPYEALPADPARPTAEPPTPQDVSFAATASEASALAGFTVLQPAWLPDGYQADLDWSVAQQEQGTIVVRQYQSAQGAHFLLMNQYQYGSDDQFAQTYGDNETVSDVQVRGQQALAISGRLMDHPLDRDAGLVPTNWLLWEEGGVNYTLWADDLTLDELMQVAAELAE